jgi:hypothetical protein
MATTCAVSKLSYVSQNSQIFAPPFTSFSTPPGGFNLSTVGDDVGSWIVADTLSGVHAMNWDGRNTGTTACLAPFTNATVGYSKRSGRNLLFGRGDRLRSNSKNPLGGKPAWNTRTRMMRDGTYDSQILVARAIRHAELFARF